MTWLWIVLAIIGLVVAWWLLKILMAVAVPVEVSGRALLKQELKHLGVDVARIPDRAIDELVTQNVAHAKGLALSEKIYPRDAGQKYWRANLVQLLEFEALSIRDVLNGERSSSLTAHVLEIMVRNGVVGHTNQ